MTGIRGTAERLVLGAIVVLSLSGCGRDAAESSDETAADSVADTAVGPATAVGRIAGFPGGDGLGDASIMYLLDQASRLDSVAGAAAASKGTSSEVRDFGRAMVRDHARLRREGAAVARVLGMTPEAPPGDNSQVRMDRTMAMLNGAARGRDFDRAYLEREVEARRSLLEFTVTAMEAARLPEVRNFLQKAAPVLMSQLDRAQAIQRRLL